MQTATQPGTPAVIVEPATAAAQVAGAANVEVAPQAAYQVARAVRRELRSQLDALVSQRHGILRELEDHNVQGPATAGMQLRIAQLDSRIAELDIAIAKADAQVAIAAGVPGAVVDPPRTVRDGPPEEVFFVVPVLLTIALFPVMIAFARRIWTRGSSPAASPQLGEELAARLSRLEQMGEATALEVERIGEGQRFVTRLLTEKADHALGVGEPVNTRR
ncbi:MAG: hypothetical protein ACSLFK_13065 [Gemmatimonadaceae bacterium]